MKRMLYVLTFCGAVLAAVVAAVRFLRLPQEYVWYTAALMAVVVVIASIVTFISYLKGRRDQVARAKGQVSQEELDREARSRAFAGALRQLARHQRASAPARPRLLAAPFEAPWVLVLGPRGHGKTRLIGGPHPKKQPEIDQDGVVKGADVNAASPEDRPRCFSAPGQAVFVEVPEALARRDDLRRSWEAALRLLARRPLPIRGVVLCVAADDLAGAPDPAARATELAEALAASVQDVVTALQVHVPIFLVVTRLDRLSGFGDVLGSLDSVSGPLGLELPDGRSEELALKELRGRWDALCRWLDGRALRLLGRFREPDLPRQGRIYTFVQQVAALQEPLATIAAKLLAVRGADPVRLRGVFLTSALQDGEPALDAVLDELARKTGGSFAPPSPDAQASRRAFLDELVSRVILRDARLARPSERAARRSALRRGALGAGLAALGLYVGVSASGSDARNRELAQRTADAAAALRAELGGQRRAPIEIGKVAPLRELLGRWEDETGEDLGDVRGWGLFRDEVVPPLQAFYKKVVLAGVVAVLRDRAEVDLVDFAARFEAPDAIPEPGERQLHRDTLRFYLLVTRDKKPYEKLPVSDAKERQILTDALRRRWRERSRSAVRDEEFGALESAAAKFMALAVDADFKLPRDQPLIERVQEILKRETSEKAIVDAIVDEVSADPELERVGLRRLTGIPDIENGGLEVRGAFTREGWAAVRVKLAAAEETDAWVLGLADDLARRRQRQRGAEMRAEYFQMYIDEWRRFIKRMQIVPPTNLDAGKALMTDLVRGPRLPLSKVYAELKTHTEIADDYVYGDTKSLTDFFTRKKERGGPGLVRAEEVRATFARLVAFAVAAEGKEGSAALDQYHGQLKKVGAAIGRALENKEEEKALIEALKEAIEDTKMLVTDAELDTWTPETSKLLLAPLEELLRMLVRDRGTGAVTDWCSAVVEPMYERLAGRYPFAADARSEATLADFEEFFHPERGVIRRKRDDLLTSYVIVNGNTVEPRDRGRSEGPKLDPQVIRFLARAIDVGRVMFSDTEMRVDFELILACNPKVSKVEVTIDGKKVDFGCGNERPTRVRWPGKEGQGATLAAFGKQGRKELRGQGEWGLFELLERSSKVPEKAEDVLLFTFDMTAYNLDSLDVRIRPIRSGGGTLFFGFSSSSKVFLAPLRDPDVLPPKRLFSNMSGCGGG